MTLYIIADDDLLIGRTALPPADVLISCGDLWDQTIERAVKASQCRQAFAVRGNHDPDAPFPVGVVDLHLQVVEFEGVRFGGFNGCWRYKPRGNHLWSQSEVRSFLADLPAVDVFVAHNSPQGIHECDDDVHQGFEAFREYVERARPRYFLHGHQHVNAITKLGDTDVIGVYGEYRMQLDPIR